MIHAHKKRTEKPKTSAELGFNSTQQLKLNNNNLF